MFSQGRGIEVHSVGTTCVPHPLLDLCELSVLPWPCKADVLQTDGEGKIMKINSDDTFVWESSLFVIPPVSPAAISARFSRRLFGAGNARLRSSSSFLEHINQGLISALNTKGTCTTGKWSLTAVLTVT